MIWFGGLHADLCVLFSFVGFGELYFPVFLFIAVDALYDKVFHLCIH